MLQMRMHGIACTSCSGNAAMELAAQPALSMRCARTGNGIAKCMAPWAARPPNRVIPAASGRSRASSGRTWLRRHERGSRSQHPTNCVNELFTPLRAQSRVLVPKRFVLTRSCYSNVVLSSMLHRGAARRSIRMGKRAEWGELVCPGTSSDSQEYQRQHTRTVGARAAAMLHPTGSCKWTAHPLLRG